MSHHLFEIENLVNSCYRINILIPKIFHTQILVTNHSRLIFLIHETTDYIIKVYKLKIKFFDCFCSLNSMCLLQMCEGC